MSNSKFQPFINIANRVKEITSYTGRSFVVVFDGRYVGLLDEKDRKTIGIYPIAEHGFERFVYFIGRLKSAFLIMSYRDNGIKVEYDAWSKSIQFLKDTYGYVPVIKI